MHGRKSRGLARMEMMVVAAIIVLVTGLMVSRRMQSRLAANESVAVGALRTLISAQTTYINRYGVYGSLGDLAAEGLIDAALASGRKSGYFFGAVHNPQAQYSYCFVAVPMAHGPGGRKQYAATQQQVIFEAEADISEFASALAESPTTAWHGHPRKPTPFTTSPENDAIHWVPISR
jgi:type II secretory pathway pseudopilin PulG